MQASVRIIPTVIDIGQAAGLAAAEAVRSGSEPNRLDGHLLREKLGAYRTD
ncbi:MAG: FAD-dependent oxidoreductase [Lachnospiraceae bacterium]|nr:FAD-dependent oxidoreductase [Lachnospiraceae bacterium]